MNRLLIGHSLGTSPWNPAPLDFLTPTLLTPPSKVWCPWGSVPFHWLLQLLNPRLPLFCVTVLTWSPPPGHEGYICYRSTWQDPILNIQHCTRQDSFLFCFCFFMFFPCMFFRGSGLSMLDLEWCAAAGDQWICFVDVEGFVPLKSYEIILY